MTLIKRSIKIYALMMYMLYASSLFHMFVMSHTAHLHTEAWSTAHHKEHITLDNSCKSDCLKVCENIEQSKITAFTQLPTGESIFGSYYDFSQYISHNRYDISITKITSNSSPPRKIPISDTQHLAKIASIVLTI